MELDLYEPAYYTKINGSDPEIRAFLDRISSFVADKTYSSVISIVRIAPVVAPQEILDQGLWAEEIKCWPSSNDAAVFIHIPYEEYVNASMDKKKKLLLLSLFSAMERIGKRSRIDVERFINDIKIFWEEENSRRVPVVSEKCQMSPEMQRIVEKYVKYAREYEQCKLYVDDIREKQLSKKITKYNKKLIRAKDKMEVRQFIDAILASEVPAAIMWSVIVCVELKYRLPEITDRLIAYSENKEMRSLASEAETMLTQLYAITKYFAETENRQQLTEATKSNKPRVAHRQKRIKEIRNELLLALAYFSFGILIGTAGYSSKGDRFLNNIPWLTDLAKYIPIYLLIGAWIGGFYLALKFVTEKINDPKSFMYYLKELYSVLLIVVTMAAPVAFIPLIIYRFYQMFKLHDVEFDHNRS